MASKVLHYDKILHTNEYHGHSIKFSPTDGNILVLSGAENFGIRGNGCLIFFNLSAQFPIIRQFIYCDALFDLCWLKSAEGIILTGAGDGCIQIWSANKPNVAPVSCKKIHGKEVSSVDSCKIDSEYVATSSWDSSVTLCEVNRLLPTCILQGHNGIVYEAAWSHTDGRSLASVSEDGTAMIWSPFASNKPSLSLPSLGAELLSCDWSYSNPNLLVTASTDAVINGWDMRATASPVFRLHGHENAIRKVRFSPFISDELVSVSYDFTTRLWDVSTGFQSFSSRNHSEFVYGVDYSLLIPGVIADCSWDQKVHVYRVRPSFTSHNQGDISSLQRPVCVQSILPATLNETNLDPGSVVNRHNRPLPPLPSDQSPRPPNTFGLVAPQSELFRHKTLNNSSLGPQQGNQKPLPLLPSDR